MRKTIEWLNQNWGYLFCIPILLIVFFKAPLVEHEGESLFWESAILSPLLLWFITSEILSSMVTNTDQIIKNRLYAISAVVLCMVIFIYPKIVAYGAILIKIL